MNITFFYKPLLYNCLLQLLKVYIIHLLYIFYLIVILNNVLNIGLHSLNITNLPTLTNPHPPSETQHTIGYGTRVITSHCPVALVTMMIQSVFGVLIQCVMAGLIFAKVWFPPSQNYVLNICNRSLFRSFKKIRKN